MPYIVTIHNQSYSIDRDEDQRSITLDGTQYPVDWKQLASLVADAKGNVAEGGQYSLLVGDQSYDLFARRITKAGERQGETYEILVAGQRFEVNVEDERTRLLAGRAKSGADAGAATVNAPMPGLVVGVPFDAGASVAAGQTVVVLEAMKMENDLSSPIAGVLKEVRVTKGQTVDQGEVLVVIEAEEA
jgi:biotin carboxyl carrier protein